jgi:6-phosphogluconolactonase (cycloisomerase 2 family)
MANNKDFKVKNGIQPTVYNEGVGTVVSGSENYSFSGASYDSKSFSVQTQEGNFQDMAFKPDGTKVYAIGFATDAVYQYSLSTAWDISTASYDSVSLSVSSQDLAPIALELNADGTSLYVTGSANDTVFQYNLSTAYDLSTASYASKSFNLSTQNADPKGIVFKSGGTKMYYLAGDTIIYQYSLSTAYDISTVSYDSISHTLSSDTIRSMQFNSDGTAILVCNDTDNTFEKYTLSTPYDITTISATPSETFTATGQATRIKVKPDGSKVYQADSSADTIYQYSTVLNTASLDLSTGAVFDYTPTSDVQVTVSNPAASGTVSSATLLLTAEDSTGVGSTFSTTLYSGTATSEAHTVTNNIDLSTDGGLLWVKKRDSNISNTSHQLYDTERGASAGFLSSDSTNAQSTGDLSSFNTDGFTWNASTGLGSDYLGSDYVSWVFKKQSSFFDVVTYTGTGSAQNISHNLGTTPGFIIVKGYSTAGRSWACYHRSLGYTKRLLLNYTSAEATDTTYWNAEPTDTVFSVGTQQETNLSGTTFVAYLFAHDTAADGLIQCGSYTGNGSASGPSITLGWEPQWILIKSATYAGQGWYVWDNVRGIASGSDPILQPHLSNAEANVNWLDLTSTGFTITDNGFQTNGSGETYIYMAIRNPYIPTITYDTDLEWSGGTAPAAPAEGETDVITINTRDGGTTYQAVQAIDGAK